MTTCVTNFDTFTATSTSLHCCSGALKFYERKSNASLGSGQSRLNILNCLLIQVKVVRPVTICFCVFIIQLGRVEIKRKGNQRSPILNLTLFLKLVAHGSTFVDQQMLQLLFNKC